MGYDPLLPVVLLGGLATYLTRYLPVLLSERLKGRQLPPRLHRFLLALGPSAIAALLALSLADLLPAEGWRHSAPLVLAGTAAVLVVHRLTHNPAWATLAGALGFGLAGFFPGL